MLDKFSTTLALLLGLAALANGVLMTLAPESWYWLVPGVPERGAFNQHFLRDIGINYMLIGAAFVCGAIYPAQRLILWWVPTAWLVGHALFHVWEVLVGICGPASLFEDFAGVTLPALVALGLLYYSAKVPKDE